MANGPVAPALKRKPLRWRDALKIVSMCGEDFICAYCDCLLDPDTAEVDHRVPISAGGTNDLENLEISCRECNRAKGSKELTFELHWFLRHGEMI